MRNIEKKIIIRNDNNVRLFINDVTSMVRLFEPYVKAKVFLSQNRLPPLLSVTSFRDDPSHKNPGMDG